MNAHRNITYTAFALALFLFAGVPSAYAAGVTVTAATGGSSVSADTTSGTYTLLTGPTITEGASGDVTGVGSKTIIFTAPTGFAFNTASPVTATFTALAGSVSSCFKFSSNTATPTATTITFTVSGADGSGTKCSVTWGGTQVRPTSGTITSGNITNTGSNTSIPSGSSNNYGTLTEVAGPVASVAVTPTPVSVSPGSSVQFSATAKDAYGNTRGSDTFTWSVSSGGGTITSGGSYTAANQLGTYTVTATDASVSGTATVNIVAPDLVAGAITPTTATAGAAQTYNSTVTNSGTGTTGSSFVTLFQTANAVSGGNAIGAVSDAGTATVATLAASSTANASFSYSTTTAGTFYMRACADKSSAANTGVITESDETNNCGVWTAVAVSAGAFTHYSIGAISNQFSNSPFAITVTALDANNNPVLTYAGTVDYSTTAGTITPAQSGSFTNGVRNESVFVSQATTTATITACQHPCGRNSISVTSNTFIVSANPGLAPIAAGNYQQWNPTPSTVSAVSAVASDDSGSSDTYISPTNISGSIAVDLFSASSGRSGTWTSGKSVTLAPTETAPTIGSSADTLGLTWATSDFSNNNFTLQFTNNYPTGVPVLINDATVNVFYGAQSTGLYAAIDQILNGSNSSPSIGQAISTTETELSSSRHISNRQKVMVLVSPRGSVSGDTSGMAAADASKTASTSIYTLYWGNFAQSSFNYFAQIASATTSSSCAYAPYQANLPGSCNDQNIQNKGDSADIAKENNDGDNFYIVDPNDTTGTAIANLFTQISQAICPATVASDSGLLGATSTSKILVVTHVVNNDGGKLGASSFPFTVSGGAPTPGVEPPTGVSVPWNPNTAYSVAQSPVGGYEALPLSFGCSSDTGGVLDVGETRLCMVTNDDAAVPPAINIDNSTWQELPTSY